MQWLFLTLVALHVATAHTARMEKEHQEYLVCTSQTEFNPGVCDCTATRRRKCFVKLTITKNKEDNPELLDESQIFSVNGGRIGPTIIAKYNQLIVADVYNEINDTEHPENGNTSMHWHGMHQWNTAWMDGVGMLTQWPTKPRNAFRHVLRAHPAGTHWYHSHMLYQRDEGILGAFIVRDKRTRRTRELLKNVVDDPGETMLTIRDHIEQDNDVDAELGTGNAICEPDRSVFPLFPIFGNRIKTGAFRLNGVKLDDTLPKVGLKKNLKPIFYVQRGENFRFRIIGIMSTNAIRLSIDKHKLHVMATDGYLTQPFETDILIVHIAERYDFILKTNESYAVGTVFPIRIETVAVKCNDYSTPEKVGYAYLQYTDSETPGEPIFVHHYGDQHRCEVEECTALNCPFQNYPPEANTICHNVGELRLLNPTPDNELPQHNSDVVERFYNFALSPGPVINGIKNELPQNVPFINAENEAVINKCTYKQTKTCETPCAQTVYLKKNKASKTGTFSPQTIRFVFSSISETPIDANATNVGTHPVHLHGHSFFVTKIGYPRYDENGAIIGMNPNLTLPRPNPNCGPAHWTDNEQPSGIVVDSRTVRKDVIIVPAGGYVVVEFLAENPGWWFMHCHIDQHSNGGMAITVNELPSCQTPPQNDKYKVTDPHWLSALRFVRHELFDNVCDIRRYKRYSYEAIFSDEVKKQGLEMEMELDEMNMQNLLQETFDPVANTNHDYERVSPYHKRGLFQSFGSRADNEQRKFQEQDWDASNV